MPLFEVDLTPFSESKQNGSVGRPILIGQLAADIRSHVGTNPEKWSLTATSLRHLWKFLDLTTSETGEDTDTLQCIGDSLGQLLKIYFLMSNLSTGSSRKYLSDLRSLLSKARKRHGISENDLLWPAIRRDRGTKHKDVSPEIVKGLYTTLKMSFVEMSHHLELGQRLLNEAGSLEPAKGRWSYRGHEGEVRKAELANALVDTALTDDDFVFSARLEPTGDGYARTAFISFGLARLFVPTYEDTATAFFLVALHTGWNPETVFNIDISSLESWCDSRLTAVDDRKTSVAIYGFKGRTGREQISFSLKTPTCHPYQVISEQIRRTKRLRQAVEDRIVKLEGAAGTTRADANELFKLREMLKSPWLYLKKNSIGPGGRIGVLKTAAVLTGVLREHGRETIARQHSRNPGQGEKYEALRTLVPSDLRDGFSSFIYKNSSYNELVLQHALGHRSVNTTRHYMRQRQQIAERFKEFTRFLSILFEEIRQEEEVDPTILYLRIRVPDLTQEQRTRLADHRQRTRVGFGCLDPYRPPKEIMASGVGPCSVQRCVLCRHGVVFADSLAPLAVRMAELIFIRGQMAVDRFHGSTFHAEWQAIDALLQTTFKARDQEFDSIRMAHLDRLRSGNAYLFAEALDHSIGVVP